MSPHVKASLLADRLIQLQDLRTALARDVLRPLEHAADPDVVAGRDLVARASEHFEAAAVRLSERLRALEAAAHAARVPKVPEVRP